LEPAIPKELTAFSSPAKNLACNLEVVWQKSVGESIENMELNQKMCFPLKLSDDDVV